MKITARSRLVLRAQSAALALALCALAGLAAWASTTWTWQADWTRGQRNSLTAASRKVLATLADPVTITAFVRPGSHLARAERQLLGEYRRADPKVRIRFVNPDIAVAEMRRLGITLVGELYVSYGARGEKLANVSEAGITNALLRLARGSVATVAFVTGHGEANPDGARNFDLGNFAAALKGQGFRITTVDLAAGAVPAGTALVVLAGPQEAYLPREVKRLTAWVAHGGGLLWLHDPGPVHGLAALARALAVKPLDGTIVDTTSHRFGIADATELVISHYGDTPITNGFNLTTLFPDATGFEPVPAAGHGWRAQVFVHSRRLPASWLMHGATRPAEPLYRPGTDTPGPVPIGIALARPAPGAHGHQQRAAVVGDTSFLTNQFLGNGGNLNLGLNLFNWLVGQNRYLDIAPVQAPDRTLTLSRAEQGGIGLGFLAALPLAFLVVAAVLWLRRRRR